MIAVHLHIDLAKNVTTSLHAALQRRSGGLAERGVLVPGGRHRAHRMAAYDLLGRRIEGDEGAQVAGAFRRLVEEIDAYDDSTVVASGARLALARPVHVPRLARRLRPHRLFV